MGISHGRGTRRWKYVIRPSVLAESDVCIWCGHAGAMTVDHIIPIAVAPELAEVRSNLGAIHGQEGCPVCPPRYSRRTKSMQPRRCNLEKGKRLTGPPTAGSRQW
jgi:5-methylcytosine-specific restriction endonuclease McrA